MAETLALEWTVITLAALFALLLLITNLGKRKDSVKKWKGSFSRHLKKIRRKRYGKK